MWLLDAFEASGKPVALAVDGVCDETIEHQTLTRIGGATRTSPLCRCESGSGLERGRQT